MKSTFHDSRKRENIVILKFCLQYFGHVLTFLDNSGQSRTLNIFGQIEKEARNDIFSLKNPRKRREFF